MFKVLGEKKQIRLVLHAAIFNKSDRKHQLIWDVSKFLVQAKCCQKIYQEIPSSKMTAV